MGEYYGQKSLMLNFSLNGSWPFSASTTAVMENARNRDRSVPCESATPIYLERQRGRLRGAWRRGSNEREVVMTAGALRVSAIALGAA
ncbi:MAG: hypothetical protein ACREDI_04255, partial [Roseiarcus sp.]